MMGCRYEPTWACSWKQIRGAGEGCNRIIIPRGAHVKSSSHANPVARWRAGTRVSAGGSFGAPTRTGASWTVCPSGPRTCPLDGDLLDGPERWPAHRSFELLEGAACQTQRAALAHLMTRTCREGQMETPLRAVHARNVRGTPPCF